MSRSARASAGQGWPDRGRTGSCFGERGCVSAPSSPGANASGLAKTLGLPNLRVLEFLSEHFLTRNCKPLVEDGSVDLAEIEGVLQVAHAVVGQAGVFTDRSGFDFGADQEHRRCGAV